MRDLRDRQAAARIDIRLGRISQGSLGDTRSVGDGIYELRFNFGPGYRVYFTREGNQVIVLLCGGDKDSQRGDVSRAKRLAEERRQSE